MSARRSSFVRSRLANHEPYRAWTTVEVIAENGFGHEVNLLVVTPAGVFVVNVKSSLASPSVTGSVAPLLARPREGPFQVGRRHRVADEPCQRGARSYGTRAHSPKFMGRSALSVLNRP